MKKGWMYSYLINPDCRLGGKDLLTSIKHKGGVAKNIHLQVLKMYPKVLSKEYWSKCKKEE